MKNIKRILTVLLIGIFTFLISDNVYAGQCSYEGAWGKLVITDSLPVLNNLIHQYSPNTNIQRVSDLYAFIDTTNADKSDIKQNVKFAYVQYVSTHVGTDTHIYYNTLEKAIGAVDDEWKRAFIKDGSFKCVNKLYYNSEFEDKIGIDGANDTWTYTFSPYDNYGEFKASVEYGQPKQENTTGGFCKYEGSFGTLTFFKNDSRTYLNAKWNFNSTDSSYDRLRLLDTEDKEAVLFDEYNTVLSDSTATEISMQITDSYWVGAFYNLNYCPNINVNSNSMTEDIRMNIGGGTISVGTAKLYKLTLMTNRDWQTTPAISTLNPEPTTTPDVPKEKPACDIKKDSNGNDKKENIGTYIFDGDDYSAFYSSFWSIINNSETGLKTQINKYIAENLSTFDVSEFNNLSQQSQHGGPNDFSYSGELAQIYQTYGVDPLLNLIEQYNENHERCYIDEKVMQNYISVLESIYNEAIVNAQNTRDNTLQTALDDGTITQDEYDYYNRQFTSHDEKLEDKISNLTKEANAWYTKLLKVDDDVDCQGILDKELVGLIRRMFTWVRILVPILLIVFGIMDFGKAVLSEEKDEMNKAIKTFAKRVVIAIIIFFVPTIIHILVEAYNLVSPQPLTDLPGCGIK